MKIAINARMLLPQLEGIGHYTYQLIDHLSIQHPHIQWHIIQDRDHHVDILNRPNIVRHILSPQARHPVLWYYWFEWGIPRLLRQIDADLYFSPDGYGSLRTATKKVITIHDLAYLHYPDGSIRSHRWYLEKYMKQWLESHDRIIAVSQFTADDISRQFSISPDKIHAVPNGVSKEFQPLTQELKTTVLHKYTNGRPYFLYVGSMHPRKNIVRLVSAFEKFKKETANDICLLLVGRLAWNNEEIKAKLENTNCKKDIIQLPHTDNIAEIVGAASLMCYVSLFEGFGLPVLESMSCNVPVLTSTDSPMEEIIGSHGYCVDPTDISAITAAMISCVDEPKPSETRAALEKAKQYSWARTAEKTFDVLASLL